MKTRTWENMGMDRIMTKEGRSEDFIAGAHWAWDINIEGIKMYYEMKESFKQSPDIGILQGSEIPG